MKSSYPVECDTLALWHHEGSSKEIIRDVTWTRMMIRARTVTDKEKKSCKGSPIIRLVQGNRISYHEGTKEKVVELLSYSYSSRYSLLLLWRGKERVIKVSNYSYSLRNSTLLLWKGQRKGYRATRLLKGLCKVCQGEPWCSKKERGDWCVNARLYLLSPSRLYVWEQNYHLS